MKLVVAIALIASVSLAAIAAVDPYETLSKEEREILKPQIERWVNDQLKQDWSDMWDIQDQTPELKNELLLGKRDAPDLDREQYVQAMRETIGSGYPQIKAFKLTEVDKEKNGFQVVGCAKLQREEWKQTSIQYVHVRLVNGKALFGMPEGSGETCKL